MQIMLIDNDHLNGTSYWSYSTISYVITLSVLSLYNKQYMRECVICNKSYKT